MRGEFYPDNWVEPVFSFRWPVNCTPQAFFAGVRDVVPDTADKHARSMQSPIQIAEVTDDEKHSDFEIYMFLKGTGEVFSTPYANTISRLADSADATYELKQAILDSLKSPVDNVDIQAIRISTDHGDFQVDIEDDTEGKREVFVIGHRNTSEEIAYLRAKTGPDGVNPARLNAAIREITGIAPRHHSSSPVALSLPGHT